MKSFVITLENHGYSNTVADRCINGAKKHGIVVEKFYGINKEQAYDSMIKHELKWTWAHNNTERRICPITKLQQFPYTAVDLRSKIGCSMSHYLLWKKCIELDETILILEHDAVFLRALPDFEFNGICQINDPLNATRGGFLWSETMINRGMVGAHEKTWVTSENERDIPDGLAGNSAYLIKPWAAHKLLDMVHKVGLWPNDAIMNKQLFPYLEEYYPFITTVQQDESTTTT